TQVVDIRLRALLRLTRSHRLTRQDFRDLTLWILYIAGDNRVFRTDYRAGRLQTKFCAMRAIVALGRRVAAGIDIQRVVGTGLHTRFAANAAIRIKVNDAVRALIESTRRTDLHARCIVAVITTIHQEIAARVWELSLLDILHPCPVYPDRHIMLSFTCNRTGVATNALTLINNKRVLLHTPYSP